MADTFYIRIGKVDGTRVVLHCLTGFDGDPLHLATSRSFALIVLLDARSHARDYEYVAPRGPGPVWRAHVEIGRRAHLAASPLNDAVPEDAPTWEAEWHRINAPRFIAGTKLLARRNDVFDPAVFDEVFELGETWKLVEAGWQRLHNYDLEVEVTDPRYVAHLVEGELFATAAFDAWDE